MKGGGPTLTSGLDGPESTHSISKTSNKNKTISESSATPDSKVFTSVVKIRLLSVP